MSTAMPASATRSTTDDSGGAAGLGDPELRRFLLEYVKKRVPRGDVDDVVQTVLLDALAATKRPEDPAELRKWVVGIARHKCADLHRRAGRERPADDELPEQPAAPAALEERSLVRWAEEQAQSSREAGKTLDWMAREGEGDKLEHIAEEEALPPARVRQRVSRMRRFLKERWLAEVALVAALGALAILVWSWLRKNDEPIVADPTKPPPSAAPSLPELERLAEGRRIRVGALEVCRSGEDQRCIEQLDRAKELDPTGDEAPEVREAREAATRRLREQDQQQNDAKQKSAPAPSPSNDTDLQKALESDAKKETKPAPGPSQTATPKAPPPPPKAPPTFDKKSEVIDLSDSPVPAPAPKAPQTTAPTPPKPAEPPKESKAAPTKAPLTKGGGKGGKPMPPDQMQQQMKK
jgi:DNA-directed RNA polymerase specialized sigma24 family protein